MSFLSSLRNLSKSKTDRVLGGVCGGLGTYTPIPTWMWRAAFLVWLLVFGSGGLAYTILWIALPEEKEKPPAPVDHPESE